MGFERNSSAGLRYSIGRQSVQRRADRVSTQNEMLVFQELPVDDVATRERMRPENDHYTFHITLAYPIEPLGDAEKAELQAAMPRWLTRLVENAPIIALGAPEYCTSKDMFYFKRILRLT